MIPSHLQAYCLPADKETFDELKKRGFDGFGFYAKTEDGVTVEIMCAELA